MLFRYDGHNIASPEALIERVRGGTPGREVTIDFVRAGKAETRKVVLGEAARWPRATGINRDPQWRPGP